MKPPHNIEDEGQRTETGCYTDEGSFVLTLHNKLGSSSLVGGLISALAPKSLIIAHAAGGTTGRS
jgi:hypothetical protein